MTKIVNVIEFYPQDMYNLKDVQVTSDNGIAFFFYCIKIRHFSSNRFSSVTQSCLTLRPHGLQPTRLLCPWDFPGKSTGVRCHCLLRKRAIP